MPLSLALLRALGSESAANAWRVLFDNAWATCASPIPAGKAAAEVTRRDAAVGASDLFLASAGWDLWERFETSVPHTADALAEWWAARPRGRAVLILDALSLREVPWLLQQATHRGYTTHQARPTAAELPADTTPFASALRFGSRSALQNNRAPATHRLPGALTESTDLPWIDCAAQVPSAPDYVLWHRWPDERLHALAEPGRGIAALAQEAAETLCSDEFWSLVERLTTGRRLVVTADHGYAASGQFPDTSDPAQAEYLKARFRSGRSTSGAAESGANSSAWTPPIDLALRTAHGDHAYVLGRRKWKSQGGYPTLAHGGLTVLEVVVPFVELSRSGSS